MNKRIAVATALWLGMSATTAATAADAAKPCLTEAEAEAITLVALPELIRGTGIACAATLPPNALLRQPSSALVGKYQAAADASWPAARTALAKVSPPEIASVLQTDYARPMLTGMLSGALVGKVNTSNCVPIDRAINLLAPLPPQNTAAIVVMFFQLVSADKAKKAEPSPLPICPMSKP